jgi:hypothetical protein
VADAVDVMDIFTFDELAADHALHHLAVLEDANLPTVYSGIPNYVAATVDDPAPITFPNSH